jgi:hypothetical protein
MMDRRLRAPRSRRPQQAMKRCPACRSTNVRRSGCCSEERFAHALHSPYRCNDCNERFWLLSRSTRIGALVAGAFVSAAMLFVVGATLLHGPLEAAAAAPDSASPSSASSLDGSSLRDGSGSGVPIAATLAPPR